MDKGLTPSVRDRFTTALERSRGITGSLEFEMHFFVLDAVDDGAFETFVTSGGHEQMRLRMLGVSTCLAASVRVAMNTSVNEGWEKFLSLFHGYFGFVAVDEREQFANGLAEVFEEVSQHCTSDNVPILASGTLAG